MLHVTEIFQCFLSAREVARTRDRERINGGLGPQAEDQPPQTQQERRVSRDLPEGQDVYTAACNSVIHRCALLILGVSPVVEELQKRREEEQAQPLSGGTPEGGGLMTRCEQLGPLLQPLGDPAVAAPEADRGPEENPAEPLG